MKTVPTFTATIYVGLKDTDTSTGCIFGHDVLKQVCQKYCDETGFCVTYTETEYIYTTGNEPGAIVGIINYPRFPSDAKTLRERAITLAKLLQKAANQYKVTVVMPDETVMIEREDL
jgi:hypothetical protein